MIRRAIAAVSLAAAIAGMHYAGMAAASFCHDDAMMPKYGVEQGTLAAGVTIATIVLLLIMLGLSIVDRKLVEIERNKLTRLHNDE